MATIEYNVAGGTQRMDAIRITSWKQEMILAPDGVSVEGQRHTVVGDGIISGSSPATYNAKILAFRKEWNDRGRSLIIDYEGNDIISLTEGDHFLGPHVKYNLTETTHLSAMVNFEIIFDYFEITIDPLVSVASHTWVQRFIVDEAGLSRYFVTGKLRTHREGIAPDGQAAGGGAIGGWSGTTDASMDDPSGDPTNYLIGANPDRYRQVVLPELPLGFRVARMEFAIDESGQRLIYSIEMFESPRSLPAPAKKGSANFRWKKSLNSGTGMVGLKVVDIELEAGKDTSPAELLAAAYKISGEMINYSGAGADLVLEVEFEQPDIFNKNIVIYRVVAQGNALPPNNPNGPLQPLNVNLVKLGSFIEGFDQYTPPGPYTVKEGDNPLVAQTIYRIKQSLTRHQPDQAPNVALKRAQVEEVFTDVIEQTYRIPDAQYEDLELENPPNHSDSSDPTSEHVAFSYLSVETNEEISVEDSGMRVLRPRALGSTDIPFQIFKPLVLLTTTAIIQRRGKAPTRAMLKMPFGGVLRSETFSVSPGVLDANSNRIYTAKHERIIEIADPGGDDNSAGFQNLLHTTGGLPLGGGMFTFRTWWPPNNLIAFPHDPTIEFGTSARARSVLETHGEAPEYDYGLHQELANHYFNGVE